jgi:DNA ligase-1
MQVYDTLYKLDENSNVRTWHMEREDNKYRSVSGIQGGKLVTSEWKVVDGKGIGKAYKNPDAQANAEVESKYRKQLRISYHTDVKNINSSVKFDPMLAKKYEGFTGPVFSQPKLDGLRAIITANEQYSRNGKEYLSTPHIHTALKGFFQRFPDAILDGEFYNHELKDDFNKITSCVKRTKPSDEDIKESAQFVQYWVYDVPSEGDLNFSERYQWLLENLVEGQFGESISNSYIVLVPTTPCSTSDMVDAQNVRALEEGYEGQILRLDAPYEYKRSKNLLKRKEFVDAEFELLDIEEGQGNWSGAAKAGVFRLPDGREFRAGIKGDRTRGRELLKNKANYKLGTVRFFRLTPDGIPRFGVCVAFYEKDNFEGRTPVTQEELDQLIADIASGKAIQD